MRKLTDHDMNKIVGTTLHRYYVEDARIKRGQFIDSDHYGIILGRNINGHYVTWQFHLDEKEKPYVYWGHYFIEDREAAIQDFYIRDLGDLPEETKEKPDKDLPKVFEVTIIETLKLSVEVEAKNSQEAEQIVYDNWRNSEYILTGDNFVDVEFEVFPVRIC